MPGTGWYLHLIIPFLQFKAEEMGQFRKKKKKVESNSQSEFTFDNERKEGRTSHWSDPIKCKNWGNLGIQRTWINGGWRSEHSREKGNVKVKGSLKFIFPELCTLRSNVVRQFAINIIKSNRPSFHFTSLHMTNTPSLPLPRHLFIKSRICFLYVKLRTPRINRL